MRIAIVAHAIGSKLTGNERYIQNLAEHLIAQDSKNEYCFFFTQEQARRQWAQKAANLKTFSIAQNPFRRLALDIPLHLHRLHPGVFHYQYTGPLVGVSPEIVTIHDVSFAEHPEFFRAGERLRLQLTVRRAVRSARIILTVSEFSKREIVRIFHVPETKIRVIYNGVGPEFRPIDDPGTIPARLNRYGLQRPYFLSVGNVCRRKNQRTLLRAFAHWCGPKKTKEHRLVLAGKLNGSDQSLWVDISRLGLDPARVVLLGFVADEDLPTLYAGADVFLFASLYEGFGLPVVEAMACGTPVILSQTSCLPEIAGDAALFVDPENPIPIADAIEQLLENKSLREALTGRGLRRARQFRWDITALRNPKGVLRCGR